MAESARQKRMRELGLLDSGTRTESPQVQSAQPTSTGISTRQQRMMELGVIPDTRPKVDMRPIQGPPDLSGMSNAEQPIQGPPDLSQAKQLPGRDIPIIGPILKGLDWFSETPVQNAIADVGQAFYTPGGGLANIGGATNAVGSAISRLAPSLGSTLGGRVAQTLAREAIVSAPLATGNSLSKGNTLEKSLEEGLYGAAFGGVLGAAGPVVGKGLQGLGQKYTGSKLGDFLNQFFDQTPTSPAVEPLALPVGRRDARLNAASERSNLPYGNDPVANEYQFKLPEASPQTVTRMNNIDDTKAGLSEIEGELENLQSKYQQAVQEQYAFLKTSREERGGVTQGQLQKDVNGDVVGRTGRISNNPEWYQRFYAENGKVPSNRDLYRLAQKHVDEGYQESGVQIPSWKSENGFDETVNALTSVRDQVRQGLRDLSPGMTDSPLKENVLRFQPKAKTITPRPIHPMRDPVKLNSDPILDPKLTGKPMAEISQPNNPDTVLSRLGEQVKGDKNIGFSAFGKRAGMYDNLSTDTKSQLVSKTGREPINLRDTVDTVYRKIVDDMYRFKDYDKTAEKVIGRKLASSEQTHILALNSRGSDMITKHILTQDLVDINGNVIGRSLKNATQQIPKKDIVAFEDYQVLRHGMFRMKRGEKVYRDDLEMTPDKAAQKVAEYERTNPEFKKISEEMYDFRQNLAKSWLVDTGLLDRKSWDGYLENNPFYVPNSRQFSEVEKANRGGARKGFGGQSSPLRPAPGSQRKIISPIETDIEHVDQYVKAGKRNQVMQNIVKMAQKDPEAFEGFIEIVPMTDNVKQSELKKINEIIEKDGIDGLVLNINESFDQMFNQAKTAGKKDLDNIIAVRFNGEPVYVKVNDAPFLEAITSMTPQAQGVILEAARNTTRIMKLLTTGVNPIFSLTRNLIRDIPMAYVASKTTNNPLRFSYDLLDSVVNILGNKDMYKSFKSLGGGHSSSIAADRNLLAQSKRDILPQRNIKTLPAKIIGEIENFTNALETAPRLGEFKRLTKAGNNSDDSKIAGLFAANDVTVNFKRRGNVGREIDAFVPYFNAAIQGLDKTIRTFKDKPVAAVSKAIAAITVPSVFLYAINHNNPDYKKLDNRTKDMFYLFPNGDGTFTKLPKPREGGIIFGSGIERALRAWKDKDPEAFKGFAETARVAFTPPVLAGLTKPGSFTDKLESGLVGDSILGPLSDIKSNKDFAERPIVPEYMKGLSPELQYDQRTSKLSQWIGKKINQSPKQLDYLLKSYSGIVGQLGIPLNSEGGNLKKALITQVTADPTYSNSVFTDFYDFKEKLETARKDSKFLGEPTKDYAPRALKFMNAASDRVSDVRKVMRSVQVDKRLSALEKDNKLRELQILMTAIAENANIEMNNLK